MPPFRPDIISAKLARNASGKYAGMSAQEIRRAWTEAAQQGTLLHAAVEAYYNRSQHFSENAAWDPAAEETAIKRIVPHPDFGEVAAFFRDEMHLIPWRSELKMADPTTRISGTADMIFVTPEGPSAGVVIVDWKRTATAPKENKFAMCRGELAHLQAGKFWKFAMQLNLYAHLLKTTCGVPVQKLILACLNPDGGYEIELVPFMPEETQAIVKRYAHQSQSQSSPP